MKPPKATKSLAENLPSLDAPKTVDVMPTKTARVWVSYDLGIDGDYTGFHTWLDDHEAKECGAATATFVLTYQRTIEGRIMAELKKAMSLTQGHPRIYVTYYKGDGKVVGRFLVGKRKRPAWIGFAQSGEDTSDEG